MIDFLIELFGEVLETAFSATTGSTEISKPIRFLIAAIPSIALIVLFGILAFNSYTLLEKILLGALSLAFLVAFIVLVWRIAKS